MDAVAHPLPLWAFLVGLLSSLHCVGMCGGIALLAGGLGREAGLHPLLPQLSYASGKTLTYAFLGAAAGALGGTARTLGTAAAVLGTAAGIVMVAAGLSLAGAGSPLRFPAVARAVGAVASRLRRSGRASPLLIGALNGFLPCGAVAAMLGVAVARGDPLLGALGLAAFGAGTLPALVLVSLGGLKISVLARARFSRLSGWILVVLGLWMAWRSGMPLLHPEDPAACCGAPLAAG